MQSHTYKLKVVQTLCAYFSFVALGMCSGETGPTLLDLQLITNTNTEQASYFFIAMGIGSVIGPVVMGSVFPRFDNMLLMATACAGIGIGTIILPLSSSYYFMLFMHFVVDFFKGAVNTGGNTMTMTTWKEERRTALQILHFCYAAGAIVAPIVAQPFLADTRSRICTDNNVISDFNHSLTRRCSNVNESQIGLPFPATHVQYAYLITGLINVIASVFFLCGYFYSNTEDEWQMETESYQKITNTPKLNFVIILGLVLIVILCITGIETSFASFLLTFLVTELDWSKTSASVATSIYWITFAAGRFLIIFFTNRVSLFAQNLITYTCSLLSMVGMVLASELDSNAGLWICVIVNGVATSSQFPTTIAWVEESVMSLSSQVMSMIVMCSSITTMLNSPLIGYLMQDISPYWFLYLLAIESLVSILTITVIQIWTKSVLIRLRSTSVE